jgi:predicted transcriptional regulator
MINPKIVHIIVDKLGYTPDEVMSYLNNPKESNSFVSNLYQRLLDEEMEREKTPIRQLNNGTS